MAEREISYQADIWSINLDDKNGDYVGSFFDDNIDKVLAATSEDGTVRADGDLESLLEEETQFAVGRSIAEIGSLRVSGIRYETPEMPGNYTKQTKTDFYDDAGWPRRFEMSWKEFAEGGRPRSIVVKESYSLSGVPTPAKPSAESP